MIATLCPSDVSVAHRQPNLLRKLRKAKGGFFSVVEEEKKEGERTGPQLQHAALILAFH